MDKQNVVYPFDGIYSATKMDEALTHATEWMNPENLLSMRS